MLAHLIGRLRLTALALVAVAGATLAAQSGTQPPGDPMIRDLRWRNIGNANLIGRISAVDALESNFAHVVVGSASGGVWKSTTERPGRRSSTTTARRRSVT